MNLNEHSPMFLVAQELTSALEGTEKCPKTHDSSAPNARFSCGCKLHVRFRKALKAHRARAAELTDHCFCGGVILLAGPNEGTCCNCGTKAG